jgi:site-specific recombinase XerD
MRVRNTAHPLTLRQVKPVVQHLKATPDQHPSKSAPRPERHRMALALFVQHLAVDKGLSRNTVAAYRSDISGYLEMLALAGKPDPASAEEEDIAAFLHDLKAAGVSASTLARKLSSLRAFHKLLVSEGLAQSDPTGLLQGPRLWKRLPRVLSHHEAEVLLGHPEPGTPLGLRDRALLEVLYGAGLRESEATSLRLDHLLWRTGFLRILGKGDRERMVPLGRKAWEAGAPEGLRSRFRLRQLPGKTALADGPVAHRLGPRSCLRHRQASYASHTSALICHTPARGGCGSQVGAGNVGAFQHNNNADIHECGPDLSQGSAPDLSPARLTYVRERLLHNAGWHG